jgi:hypothetical protein
VDGEVADGVLLLQGQEEDVRSRVRYLVGDEKHNGEELNIDGGWHSRDPMWRVEETADDGDSWGKTTAQSSRLSRRKKSVNGGQNR